MRFMAFLILVFLSTSIFPIFGEPALKDPDFAVEKFVSTLSFPTSMTFVGNDILVLQKNDGKVLLIRDGVLQEKPILDFNVSNNSERGLLGITTTDSHVYIYLTESTRDGAEPLGNRIYGYVWNGNELVNQTLVKNLPATPGPNHDGGAMVTGLDDAVYAVIGDLNRNGLLQNYPDGEFDDTSVILRVVPEGPYHGIGIRNSFGLAIDPVNGNLWDTENGPDKYDEINFVSSNFNSGWEKIMGSSPKLRLEQLPVVENYTYSDPEFSWEQVVAPTAISFVNSKPLEKFKNSVFVGDCNNGNLYKFELNSDRTGFVFKSDSLEDNLANTGESLNEIIFGTGFGCLTDLELGPDGFLYIVSLSEGTIYRIIPKTMMGQTDTEIVPTPQAIFPTESAIYALVVALIITAAVFYLVKTKRKNK